MKIALVTAFPPSRKALAEYGFHLADQLRQSPGIHLTVLGDYLPDGLAELPGFQVCRCWGFDRRANFATVLRAVRVAKPDLVWFNLGFASFGAEPVAAMLSLATPLLTRLAGVYTHITLHQLFETVDLADAGVKRPTLYRAGGWLATHLLLGASSVSVLLPAYRRMLQDNYKRGRVNSRSHGIFTARPDPPDFSKRGNPTHRILAFGKWGTYKRLEVLIEAFEQLSAGIPEAELVIGGGDHPKTPGYVAATAARHANSRIRFLGYLPEESIGELFQSASIAVMPYTSSAGSSGVAHLAAQYGVPIVASDIEDFRELAEHERIAIEFFPTGDSVSLSKKLRQLLRAPERMAEMAQQNFAAALQLTMPEVVQQYLRSFERGRRLRVLQELSRLRRSPNWLPGREKLGRKWGREVQSWEAPAADDAILEEISSRSA
jgi:glycosyltransferase involved in cell wall biosynthesis